MYKIRFARWGVTKYAPRATKTIREAWDSDSLQEEVAEDAKIALPANSIVESSRVEAELPLIRPPGPLPSDIVGSVLVECFFSDPALWVYERSFNAHTNVKSHAPNEFSMINRLLLDGAIAFYEYQESTGYAMLMAMVEVIARLQLIDSQNFLGSLFSRLAYILSRGPQFTERQFQRSILVQILKTSSKYGNCLKGNKIEVLLRALDEFQSSSERGKTLIQAVLHINPQSALISVFQELWRYPRFVALHTGEYLRKGCGGPRPSTSQKGERVFQPTLDANGFASADMVEHSRLKWLQEREWDSDVSVIEFAYSGSWRWERLNKARQEAKEERLDAAKLQIDNALRVTDEIWGHGSPESILTLTSWAAIRRGLTPMVDQSVIDAELERRLGLLYDNLGVDRGILYSITRS
jgi:hypothetical protein